MPKYNTSSTISSKIILTLTGRARGLAACSTMLNATAEIIMKHIKHLNHLKLNNATIIFHCLLLKKIKYQNNQNTFSSKAMTNKNSGCYSKLSNLNQPKRWRKQLELYMIKYTTGKRFQSILHFLAKRI